jgi:chromosome partitioning protein
LTIQASGFVLEAEGQPVHPKVIVIWNRKGGVGKTSLSWLLQSYLWSLGRRTLGIDADPQRNLTLRFQRLYRALNPGQLERETIVQLLTRSHSVDEIAAEISNREYPLCSTFIVPGNQDLSELSVDRFRFSEVIEPALETFEYIVVDVGPNFSPNVGSVLASANLLIVPTLVVSDELNQAVWSYEMSKKWIDDRTPRKVLLNCYQHDRSNDLSRSLLRKFSEKVPESDWLKTTVPEAKALVRNHYMTGEKLTLASERKRPFVETFGDLVEEMLGIKDRVEVF